MQLPTLRDGDLLLRPKRPDDVEADGRSAHFLAVDAADTLLGSFSVMEINAEPGFGEIGYWVAAEKAGFTDTGELVGAPRAGIEDQIYARYWWTAS